MIPVAIENIATTAIGLVFSSIIGGISGSSLAAVGLVNTVQNVLVSLASFLTTGSSVLTARLVGEGDKAQTSRAVEQSMLIAIVLGAGMALLCEILAIPVMRLVLPRVEASVFQEGLAYFRALALSLPFLLFYNAVGGMLRASGESRRPMLNAMAMNLVQLFAAYVFINGMGWNVVGAGLAYVLCRAVGATLMLITCLQHHRHFHLSLRRMLRPQKAMVLHICRLGAPITLESVSVQIAYLVAGSLAMGLGTHEASVYQVVNTLIAFSGLPQTIGGVVAVTTIGQELGARNYAAAKKSQRQILWIGIAASLILALTLALWGMPLAGLYTKDASVQKESAQLLWLMLAHSLCAICININDPILRTAGDMKCVMLYTAACVWLVRLPLTWLFCYGLGMGATGMLLANIIALFGRALFGIIRLSNGKWVYLKV